MLALAGWCLFGVTPVRAELIEVDLPGGSLNEVTRDTETGLRWLDLTVTQGKSFNEAGAAALLATGLHWRHATGHEVCNLFATYGFDVGCRVDDPGSLQSEAELSITYPGFRVSDYPPEWFEWLVEEDPTALLRELLGTTDAHGYDRDWPSSGRLVTQGFFDGVDWNQMAGIARLQFCNGYYFGCDGTLTGSTAVVYVWGEDASREGSWETHGNWMVLPEPSGMALVALTALALLLKRSPGSVRDTPARATHNFGN
ncbi:MAG: hypothetical protein GY725_01640 [bacterium]|nr:hypothetical protein [bacterium]